MTLPLLSRLQDCLRAQRDTDTITGNVSTAGAHTITVTYTDDDGDTDDDTFVLTITSAAVVDSNIYRFENIDEDADALENVTRFSGNLATAGAWRELTSGTSAQAPALNSSPYVGTWPEHILDKFQIGHSIMDTGREQDRVFVLER